MLRIGYIGGSWLLTVFIEESLGFYEGVFFAVAASEQSFLGGLKIFGEGEGGILLGFVWIFQSHRESLSWLIFNGMIEL